MGRTHFPCLCYPGPGSMCLQDCERFDAEDATPRGVAKSVMLEHGHVVPTGDQEAPRISAGYPDAKLYGTASPTSTPTHETTVGAVMDVHQTPVSLDEQLAVWDRFADRAYEMALDSMAQNYARIMELARARLIDGYAEYGDAMFTASVEDLHEDALEEAADMTNYWVARMWQAERP